MTRAIARKLLSATPFIMLLGLGATPALAETAAPAPRWDIVARTAPSQLKPGGTGEIVAVLINLGDAPLEASSAQPVTINDVLPERVTSTGTERLTPTGAMVAYAESGVNGKASQVFLECASLPGLSCKFTGKLPPGIAIEMHIPVTAPDGAEGPFGENTVEVAGGNALPESATSTVTLSQAPVKFGVERYELKPETENGSPDLQAGSHAFQLTTTLEFNQTFAPDVQQPQLGEFPSAPALLKNLNDTLPPGMLGNVTVVPQCSEVDFASIHPGNANSCPEETAIGTAVVTFKEPNLFTQETVTVPVFNLVPAPGEPARFGFEYEKVPIVLDTSVETGAGYGVKVEAKSTSQAAEVLSTVLTIWGQPNSPTHDNARGWECLNEGFKVAGIEPVPPCKALGKEDAPPFLTLPTYCSMLETSVEAESWEPGATFGEAKEASSSPALEGCSLLPFEPSISVIPDKTETSTPTGLKVEVSVPQATTLAANGIAEADVSATTLALPEGMQSSAGAANGLAVCTPGEAGEEGPGSGEALTQTLARQEFSPGEAECQNSAKIGTATIKTPLLEHELKGSVYLGSQDTNPFASPLVLYLIAEDKVTQEEPNASGVRVKLAGEVKINPGTGQLVSVFRHTPPVPFESLKLHLFDGPRASQATPAYCRTYTSTATFLASTGKEVQSSSSFAPTSGPGGGPCQSGGALPFSPSVHTGSTNNHAAAYTGFTLTLERPDGQQQLTGVSTTLPEGLAAKLASVTPCPEPPQRVEWSCGAASEIGVATTSSGLGPDPVTLSGKAYLTVGYDGAPFGLLVRTEAKAGPFNLGWVNVRSRINVNETTAEVTVTTDPGPHVGGAESRFRREELPTIIEGVPVQVKALNVTVNRPEFQFNPTSCNPLSTTGTFTGNEGGVSHTSTPFQVTNCAALPFGPKITISTDAQGSKINGTSFNVTVETPGLGQANIHKVFLTIPQILPSRLTTIQKACPQQAFEQNPASCDEGSVIGRATIFTPVFKNPLVGPAYLVSHAGASFPDVDFVLQGEGIKILVTGKTDIKKGVTFSKFETAPDAPFTKFITELPAGPHSALTPNTEIVPNYNLCGQTIKVPTEMVAQNGAIIKEETPVAIKGCASKVLTKAQKLKKALAACKKDKKKSKRAACEKAARKKYGAKASKARHGKNAKHARKNTARHG